MITQRLGSQGAPMEYWQFTVNTEATKAGDKTTGIPFNLYQQDGITLEVNWGDGTTSTLTSADYAVDDSRASVHEYTTPGIYTVSVGSAKWKNLYILAIRSTISIRSINNAVASLYWWYRSLVSIDNAIPNYSGVNSYASPTSVSSLSKNDNRAWYLLSWCSFLASIPTGLFDNNPAITDFSYCFLNCSSIATIPTGLFDNNPAVTNFSCCFYSCSSLTAIPTGLFDNNPAVTNFSSYFRGCSSLATIPTGLFDNNPAVTNFSYCFLGCSALSDFSLIIGSSKVSNAAGFVTQKTGTTRTISVPTGSTTETTFNNVASSLGLTIIGE